MRYRDELDTRRLFFPTEVGCRILQHGRSMITKNTLTSPDNDMRHQGDGVSFSSNAPFDPELRIFTPTARSRAPNSALHVKVAPSYLTGH